MKREANTETKTLEGMIEKYIFDPGFLEMLDDYLYEMPVTRKTVEELLTAIESFDLWQLYNKLMTDCLDLLSEEEIAFLKSEYDRIFDLPLPGEF